MDAVFENRRSGRERRQGDRRRLPTDPTRIPDGLDRRNGVDRRQHVRRAADIPSVVPERYDYLWRNRWP